MTRRRGRIAVGLLVLPLLLGVACGEASEVGTDVDTDIEQSEQARLGEIEREQSGVPPAEQAQQQAPPQAAVPEPQPQQQAPPPQEPPSQQEAPAVEVAITDRGFDPYYIRMFVGGALRVTNRDSTARTFTAADGSFDSGQLQPGQTWTWIADVAGEYTLEDRTRPFVVGTLEVHPQ